MSAFLEKLIELVQAFWSWIVPFAVLGDDQIGLIRRLGKYRRDMAPGLNWKWPLIEAPMVETAALDSTMLHQQSLTTADGVQVTVRGVVTHRVIDARRYILGVNEPLSVVNDVGCCVIAELVPTLSAEIVLNGDNFERVLLKRMRARAKKWGIDVESIGLADRTRARAYRLLGGV